MKRCLAVVWVLASGWVSAEAVVEAARPARPAQVAMARPTVLASDALNAALLALKQNDFAALQEALAEDKDLAEIAADWDARADQAKQRRADAIEQDPEALSGVEGVQDTWNKLLSDEVRSEVIKLVLDKEPPLERRVNATLISFLESHVEPE